jgi:7-cyano-7-deazaguanine synthase
MKKAVQVLMMTGGLDSTVMAYQAAFKHQTAFRGVYFDFDRPRSVQEKASVNRVSGALGVPVEQFDVTKLDRSFLGHLPVSTMQLGEWDFVQSGPRLAVDLKMRAGFASLVTLAAFYAQVLDVDRVSLALLKTQLEGRPVATFLNQLAATLATLQPGLPQIAFDLPFADLTKAEVVTLGQTLRVPFEETWSCVKGEHVHEGMCFACQARKRAFATAGVPDPTTYAA